jgi:hypothetical protein
MTRPKLNIFRNREFPHQVELPADTVRGSVIEEVAPSIVITECQLGFALSGAVANGTRSIVLRAGKWRRHFA